MPVIFRNCISVTLQEVSDTFSGDWRNHLKVVSAISNNPPLFVKVPCWFSKDHCSHSDLKTSHTTTPSRKGSWTVIRRLSAVFHKWLLLRSARSRTPRCLLGVLSTFSGRSHVSCDWVPFSLFTSKTVIGYIVIQTTASWNHWKLGPSLSTSCYDHRPLLSLNLLQSFHRSSNEMLGKHFFPHLPKSNGTEGKDWYDLIVE